MSGKVLDLSHVYKNYLQGRMDVPVLKDICLSVAKGEYVAVMGPSGSGKSTLMNIIGCLDKPTEGEYYLSGMDVLKMNDNKLSVVRRNNLGFIFQNFQLLPKLSAIENVALPLIYAGVRKCERRERAYEVLKKVGLDERVHFLPTQLSGGQKQRVAIARAMINNPDILLADEPTGALDSKSSIQVMELFEKINEEGATILMITHDREIAQYAKRRVTIFDGEISEGEDR